MSGSLENKSILWTAAYQKSLALSSPLAVVTLGDLSMSELGDLLSRNLKRDHRTYEYSMFRIVEDQVLTGILHFQVLDIRNKLVIAASLIDRNGCEMSKHNTAVIMLLAESAESVELIAVHKYRTWSIKKTIKDIKLAELEEFSRVSVIIFSQDNISSCPSDDAANSNRQQIGIIAAETLLLHEPLIFRSFVIIAVAFSASVLTSKLFAR